MTFPFHIILFIIAIVTTLGIGIMVIAKDSRSVINRSFCVFLLGIIISTLGFLCLTLHLPFPLYDPLIHYGGVLFTAGLLSFSYVFPNKKTFPKKTWPLFIPSLLFLCIIPFRLLIESVSFNGSGDIMTHNGPLFIPYIAHYAFCFILIIISIVRAYRETRGKARAQVEYLFMGILIMLLSLLVFNLILPIFGISYLYVIGPLSSIVFIYTTAYAIIQHELLNIRIVIQRGIIYTILSVMVIALYIVALQLASYVLDKTTSVGVIVSGALATALGAFLIGPFESYLRKITDPVFFKGGYDYAKTLQESSNILYANIAPADIIRESSQFLEKTLRSSSVIFHLDIAPSAKDQESDRSLSIPIIFGNQEIGSLLLGPKRSGDAYTKIDKQLLETFVCQAAVALERGRLFEQVEKYNAHLEELIEERMGEIKKLQEDQKQAMIDISHNLQTPLAIIQGELELLDEPVFESKIQAVKKSLDRVSDFIRQLLHLSRLDRSIEKVELSPLDLGQLLREQSEYFEVMALEKGVRLECNISENIMIFGNKRLLAEVFVNIVVNAIAYRHPERESKIQISLVREEEKAIVSIEDNGVGIAENDILQLFTRFYRSARTSKTLHGTGLGLAICKTIIEKHEGLISVSSILGEKTVVKIELPIQENA
ncbi:MAG: ATP-binding protein [Patescibacteria group bacterium]